MSKNGRYPANACFNGRMMMKHGSESKPTMPELDEHPLSTPVMFMWKLENSVLIYSIIILAWTKLRDTQENVSISQCENRSHFGYPSDFYSSTHSLKNRTGWSCILFSEFRYWILLMWFSDWWRLINLIYSLYVWTLTTMKLA